MAARTSLRRREDDLVVGVQPEDLGGALAVLGLPNVSGVWFPIYLPVFLLTAWILWMLPVPTRAVVRVGLLLLAVALAGEVLAAGWLDALDRYGDRWPYSIEVAVEEGAELGGWILIATGIAAALRPAESPAGVEAPDAPALPTGT